LLMIGKFSEEFKMGRVKEDMAVMLELLVLHETPMAILAKVDGDQDNVDGIWLPKSMIAEKHDFEVGVTYDCTMPEWLANAKGLN